MRRVCIVASLGVISSVQISLRSSDISTKSRARIFFTVFGGREAAGLYGPAVWRASSSVAVSLGLLKPAVSVLAVAAVARRLRPEGGAEEPAVGVNVGRTGSSPKGGMIPNVVLEPARWDGGGEVVCAVRLAA